MHRIRDAVHGFVPIRPVEAALVETRAFQRLRRIRQLGLTSLVYPGAEHTRFAHAIGAMHVAGQLGSALARQGWSYDVGLVRIAALLHDLGHPPLSHAGERGFRHEEMTLKLVRHGEVADVLERHGIDPDGIIELLDGTGDAAACSIVSGQLDADRMDYLLRDSRMCGVQYGEYDLARLIDSVAPNNGVAVKRAGLHAAEGLLLARYWMFLQVYFHRTRRIIDLLIEEVLPDWPADAWEFVEWDDARLLETLRTDPRPAAKALRRRELPACVVEMELGALPAHRAEADALGGLLAGAVSRTWVDSTARMKAYRPDGDVPLVEADGRVTSVFTASAVLRRMDPDVEIRRIYVPRAEAAAAQAVLKKRPGMQMTLF